MTVTLVHGVTIVQEPSASLSLADQSAVLIRALRGVPLIRQSLFNAVQTQSCFLKPFQQLLVKATRLQDFIHRMSLVQVSTATTHSASKFITRGVHVSTCASVKTSKTIAASYPCSYNIQCPSEEFDLHYLMVRFNIEPPVPGPDGTCLDFLRECFLYKIVSSATSGIVQLYGAIFSNISLYRLPFHCLWSKC